MSGFMVRSELGIHFTATSVSELRRQVDDAKKRNLLPFLNVAPDKHGAPDVNLCYDTEPIRKYIPDQLEDVVFNWYTNQPTLNLLRKGYCVDSEWQRKTLVIPLAKVKDE
jgi:hypothetical protein